MFQISKVYLKRKQIYGLEKLGELVPVKDTNTGIAGTRPGALPRALIVHCSVE